MTEEFIKKSKFFDAKSGEFVDRKSRRKIKKKMNKIEIRFNRGVARVRLTRNQWNYRMNGLIQYLSNLCRTIKWEIIENKPTSNETKRKVK